MTTIHLDQQTYEKALRNVHPMDHFDANKRIVNAVGRLTAQKLAKDKSFVEALDNKDATACGTKFHNIADKIAKKMASRLENITETEVKSEVRLGGKDGNGTGLGSSRLDLLTRTEEILAVFDWKTNAKSAIRSKGQADKHSEAVEEKYDKPPDLHEAVNWPDFARAQGGEVAKILHKIAAKLGVKLTKSEAPSEANFTDKSDAHAVSEWGEQSTTKVSSLSGSNLGERLISKPAAERISADTTADTASKSAAKSDGSSRGASSLSSTSAGPMASASGPESNVSPNTTRTPSPNAAPSALLTSSGQGLGVRASDRPSPQAEGSKTPASGTASKVGTAATPAAAHPQGGEKGLSTQSGQSLGSAAKQSSAATTSPASTPAAPTAMPNVSSSVGPKPFNPSSGFGS